MPPVRTIATNKLQPKTERTHQENQERAYIAASRRSDRSLEARVESARRASEIHKKRTGRSLRVREEDVVNEEMYEEEDDDLPNQFRRINALNPGFTSFNDRLNSYMAGHLGIRSALQHAIYQATQASQNNNQFFNSTVQSHAPQGDVMSPLGPSQDSSTNAALSPWQVESTSRPSSTLQHPFVSTAPLQEPGDHSFRQSVTSRRISFPSSNITPQSFGSPTIGPPQNALSSRPATAFEAHSTEKRLPSDNEFDSSKPTRFQSCKDLSSPNLQLASPQHPQPQIAPLTTQLPVETQQLLDGWAGPLHSDLLSGQWPNGVPTSLTGFYPDNPDLPMGARPSRAFDDKGQCGLDQTLYPSFMDPRASTTFSHAPEPASAVSAPADLGATWSTNPFHSTLPDSDYGYPSTDRALNPFDYSASVGLDSDQTSGQATPIVVSGDGDPLWNPDDFFNFG